MKKVKVSAMAIGLSLCLFGALSAAIINVPDDQPTIQAGIDAAVNGDTVLVADGTYTGSGNRDIDFHGKSITVMSANGPESTIVNCEGNPDNYGPRGFIFQSGEDSLAILEGFTIKNGYDWHGGGIMINKVGPYPQSATPTIVNCILLGNKNLGAYCGSDCDATFIDCRFISNDGGLQCDNSSPTLINCQFIGNITNEYIQGVGGVHLHNSFPSFTNCLFQNNYARAGGGLNSYLYSNPILVNCIFLNNSAAYSGGGLNCEEIAYATLLDCSFINNECDSIGGGAIWCEDSSSVSIVNCTFVNNSGTKGTAITYGDSSLVNIENSIIAYNENIAVSSYMTAGEVDIICTDIYGNIGGDWLGDISNQLGVNGNISLNPRFCDTANNDFSLYSSSPCLPENNDCGILIGMYGFGCNDAIISAKIENEIMSNVTSHSPVISWEYFDPDSFPEDSFEIAVGTDNNWDYAEMWNPSPFLGPDTSIEYYGSPLTDGETYYTRIRVHNSQYWSYWYELSFHMNSIPSIPIAISPIDNIIVEDNQPILWIQNSSDAEIDDILSYDFVVANDTTFGEPYPIWDDSVAEGTDSTGWQVTEPLNENWHYFWSARAFDQYEYSDWSETETFWVNAIEEPPGDFETFYPPDTDEVIITDMLSLFWWGEADESDPLDSVYYTLYISIDSDFNFVNMIDSIWTTLYTLTAEDSLDFGTHYWWKVKATDNTGRSTYSTNTRDFQTWMLGDANGDLQVNILDVTFLINYLYKEGAPPWPIVMGDIDGSCSINILDVTYLINYLYKDGPAPLVGCE